MPRPWCCALRVGVRFAGGVDGALLAAVPVHVSPLAGPSDRGEELGSARRDALARSLESSRWFRQDPTWGSRPAQGAPGPRPPSRWSCPPPPRADRAQPSLPCGDGRDRSGTGRPSSGCGPRSAAADGARVQLDRTGVTVRVQEVGTGPPVVFVHGGSNGGASWARWSRRLDGFRCVVLDRPGCGLSRGRDRVRRRGTAGVVRRRVWSSTCSTRSGSSRPTSSRRRSAATSCFARRPRTPTGSTGWWSSAGSVGAPIEQHAARRCGWRACRGWAGCSPDAAQRAGGARRSSASRPRGASRRAASPTKARLVRGPAARHRHDAQRARRGPRVSHRSGA